MGEVRYIADEKMLSDAGVNEECIDMFEGLLRKARDGEVIGAAIALQFADGSTSSACCGFLFNQRVVGALMAHVVRLSQ